MNSTKQVQSSGRTPAFIERWPRISNVEREWVLRMLETGVTNLKGTSYLREFESCFAAATNSRYCIAFSSGTAAFTAALASLNVCAGRSVLVPTYAYPACVQAAQSLGASLQFIDIAENSLQIDLAGLRDCVRQSSACIVIQHAWGNATNIQNVKELAAALKLPIVADCSHSFGATWNGSRTALHCDIGIYSLGMGKWVSGGELGVIVTDDSELADRCLMLSGMGRAREDLINPNAWKNVESVYGVKSRPHAYAVALAFGSLERVEEKLQRTSAIAHRMETAIRQHKWLL